MRESGVCLSTGCHPYPAQSVSPERDLTLQVLHEDPRP